MRTSAATASKFPIRPRGDCIVSTAAMLSDPESLSDAEAFVGSLRDAARLWQKRLANRRVSAEQSSRPALDPFLVGGQQALPGITTLDVEH